MRHGASSCRYEKRFGRPIGGACRRRPIIGDAVIPARRLSTAEGLVKREALYNGVAGHPVPLRFKSLESLDPGLRRDDELEAGLFEISLPEDAATESGIIQVEPSMKTAAPATATEFATS